ncbi:MAG: cation:proton antiporter [Pseudomonadales bacterium]|nr:cation:proton antiporter [Pseudomonadales bacterium]
MESTHSPTLLIIGSFFLAGYVAHAVGNRTRIPRVILLLLVGILAGPSGFNLVPETASRWFPIVTQAALSVIGFELGEKFLGSRLRQVGKALFILSVSKVIGTALIVFLVLLLFQVPPVLALLLAGIAPATEPAATADVIDENHARGEVSDMTLRLVAIDDAWGVILFSFILAAAALMQGNGDVSGLITAGLIEIIGAIGLGIVLGVPMALLTGRVTKGELTLMETLGFVFVCGGLAAALDFSYILACMVMGCVVTNLAQHHKRPFHAIRNVQQPFLVIFFLLAGFNAEFGPLMAFSGLSLLYIISRMLGKVSACYLGARMAALPTRVSKHIGWCTFPQAGVALGLALLAAERFPYYGEAIVFVTVGTSIVFETIGPLFTRAALRHAGEIK